jgi:hypothetical protein
MLVRDWLEAFLERHKARNPRNDWPEPDSNGGKQLRAAFMDSFIGAKVKKSEADAASVRIAGSDDVPQFVEDYLPAMMVLIDAQRAKIEETKAAKPKPIKKTEPVIGSTRCPRCLSGFALLFHPQFTGSNVLEIEREDKTIKRIPAVIAAHCVCPIGRWKRERASDEVRERIPDLAEVDAGKFLWLTENPALAAFDPDELADWKRCREELAASVGGIRQERIGTGVDRQGRPVFETPKEFNARAELGGRYEREGDYES